MENSNIAYNNESVRLLGISYLNALVTDNEDIIDMVSSGIPPEELIKSLEVISLSLLGIISQKMGISKEEALEKLREVSIKYLSEH